MVDEFPAGPGAGLGWPASETPPEQVSGQPGFAVAPRYAERRNVNPRSQRPAYKLLLKGPQWLFHDTPRFLMF